MNNKTLTFYEFDEFRLDADQKCLWHADELVSLTPKALETLLVLIRHRGEIVGKDVLLDEVWADTFVEESTLSQNILTLRKTLAAFEKDKQFILTVPRRGYRFVGEVKEIVGDEEIFVVEKRTRTHIVAEQKEIHDSGDAANLDATRVARRATNRETSRKYLLFGAFLLGAIFLAAGIFVLRYFGKPETHFETRFQKFGASQLFSGSDITRAVVAPDGKYLALIERRDGKESLIVRSIAEANSLEIVSQFDGNFIGATFSADSDYIFYAVYPQDARAGELYKIPILGGAPQQILKDIDSPVSISSDRKSLAFVRRDRNAKETFLMIADANGANERRLASRDFGEGFQNAAFSPDGKVVASAVFSKSAPEKPMEIILVETQTGAQKSLTPESWSWIGQIVWLEDGSGFAFPAYGAKSPNLTDEIWFVSYPEGKARPLENGVNGVFGISLTDDARALVTVKSNKITSFVHSPRNDLSRQTIVLTKNGDESLLPLGADWTADGKILYSTINHGNADIWTTDTNRTNPKQLTSDASADVSPRSSPDGRFIYFLSNRSGQMSVWRMNADGANPQQLTAGQEVFSLDVSPDGDWIFYTARAENIYTQTLRAISSDGKNARRITDRPTLMPRLSPDGKTIACYFPDSENNRLKLTILSAANGAVARQIESPPGEGFGQFVWEKNGRGLLLTARQNNSTALWLQPLDDKPPVKLKEWENEGVFRLALSPDGQNLFYEKGVAVNSVLLLRDAAASSGK